MHSVCSYQGKMKPALAHFLVKTFVPAGGTVEDFSIGIKAASLTLMQIADRIADGSRASRTRTARGSAVEMPAAEAAPLSIEPKARAPMPWADLARK